jgi:nucleoside-diphosphate-sugar epimerase
LEGDVTDKETLLAAFESIEAVIHTAALLRPGEDLYRINVEGTKIVLDAAEQQGVKRLIFVSSAAVYGNLNPELTMNEEHPLNPVNDYGISKLRAEELILSHNTDDHFPVTVIRPFNIYGPLQRPPQMIPLFITKLLQGEPITLNNGGLQLRDWIYIDDVTTAIRMLLTAQPELVNGEAFNLGSGTATTVREVAELILYALHTNGSLLQIGEQTVQEISGNAADITKIQQKLGWSPTTSLSNGLNMTVDWYQSNCSRDPRPN